MLVEALCVLEDGRPRAVDVPARAALPLAFPRGSSVTLRVRVLTPDGTPLDTSAYTLVWTARRRPTDGSTSWSKAGTVKPLRGPGVWECALTPADTRSLDAGSYVHDVWVTHTASGSRDQVLPISAVRLLPTVTAVP